MALRTAVCLLTGLALSGCPFALEDDFFIDLDATSPSPPSAEPTLPSTDAGPLQVPAPFGDASDCAKKGTCRGDECRGRDCLKVP